jgi:hypothetical protein
MTYQEYKISKLNGGLSVMEMVGLLEEIKRFEQE